MCRCIESIKLLDGKFFRPDRHQARIDQAFEVLWPGQKPFVLKAVLAGTGFPHKGLFKCRMVYDAQIRQIEFTPYVRRDVKSLKIMRPGRWPDMVLKWWCRVFLLIFSAITP